MSAFASTAAVSPFLPALGGGLKAVRFAPGQGGPVLRALRQRLCDEQGGFGDLNDDVLEGSAITVAVMDHGEVVAALRLHTADAAQLHGELSTLLDLEHFAQTWPAEVVVVGSRLVVLTDYRVRPVMDLLLRESYQLARDAGARFGLIACAPQLQALFTFYGFREYLPPAILPGGTAMLRMALVCEYLPALGASGSPLLPLVQQGDVGDAANAWLVQAFPMLG